MIISPIIPVWLMIIVSVVLFLFINKRKPYIIIETFIIVLLFIINLRIMIPGKEQIDEKQTNLDVIFVIDNTISMNANDCNNNTRMFCLKQDSEYIINNLEGARFAVVTFNDTSNISIPFVRDEKLVVDTISLIDVKNKLYAKGTSLTTPQDNLYRLLKSSMEKKNHKRVVIFISDGEVTSEEEISGFERLREYIDDGIVLGYGTKKGGTMKVPSKYGSLEEKVLDPDTNLEAVSKIDENNLKKIASDLGVKYIHVKGQSGLINKVNEIKKSAKTLKVVARSSDSYDDIYYIFVVPLLILVIIDFILIRKKLG